MDARAVSTKVLIVDAQPRTRGGLKALLTAVRWSSSDPDQPMPSGLLPVEIVGEAESLLQAVDMAGALKPDVLVMDVHPRMSRAPEAADDGMAAIRLIRRRWPAIRIVVLTMHAADREPVMAAGADAFLLKGCRTIDLLDAMVPTDPSSTD